MIYTIAGIRCHYLAINSFLASKNYDDGICSICSFPQNVIICCRETLLLLLHVLWRVVVLGVPFFCDDLDGGNKPPPSFLLSLVVPDYQISQKAKRRMHFISSQAAKLLSWKKFQNILHLFRTLFT